MPPVSLVRHGCESTAHLKTPFGSGWATPTAAWGMLSYIVRYKKWHQKIKYKAGLGFTAPASKSGVDRLCSRAKGLLSPSMPS